MNRLLHYVAILIHRTCRCVRQSSQKKNKTKKKRLKSNILVQNGKKYFIFRYNLICIS